MTKAGTNQQGRNVAAGDNRFLARRQERGILLPLTVQGSPTNEHDDCGFLWACGQDTFGAGILIKTVWAVTAKHLFAAPGHYNLSLPVFSGIDLEPKNSHALPVITSHDTLDVAVVKLSPGPAPSLMEPVPLATVAEFAAATEVFLCAFGPDPTQASSMHKKKTPALAIDRALPAGTGLDPDFHFVAKGTVTAPLVVPRDSGGAAYIQKAGGEFALAGVIIAAVPSQPNIAICVALPPIAAWIDERTR
jgi:hypothetical protein